jgi:hypothetical protein
MTRIPLNTHNNKEVRKKEEGRRKKEEGGGKKEEGRGRREEGRRKKEEGGRRKEEEMGNKVGKRSTDLSLYAFKPHKVGQASCLSQARCLCYWNQSRI